MSELLTTGQMIDRLKLGEIAENERGEQVYIDRTRGLVAQEDPTKNVILSNYTMGAMWRILPNYVSFEEAMRAIRDGSAAVFHDGGARYTLYRTTDFSLAFEHGYYSVGDLLEGDWTIEGDRNV